MNITNRDRKSDLHIHSTFSDGLDSPEEILTQAIFMGFEEIAIVDHVRRTSDWVDVFAGEMRRLKKISSTAIDLYSGIEAKIISPGGEIDARPEFFAAVDLVLAAFHRIPRAFDVFLTPDEITSDPARAQELWYRGMMNLLENPAVDIIAHPEAVLARYDIPVPFPMKKAVAAKAAACHKIMEVNARYRVPDDEFIRVLLEHGVSLSFGSDSHSVEEMVKLRAAGRDVLTLRQKVRDMRGVPPKPR